MPSVYDFKPKFQAMLRPYMHWLVKRGVTANQVTISAIILSLAGGIGILFSVQSPALLLTVPIILFIRMALNAIDGMIAREYNQQSIEGAIYNEVGDVLSDLFLYAPLAVTLDHNHLVYATFAAFLILSMFNEFCGVLCQALTGTRAYHGPMGKSDRALVISLYCLMLIFKHDWALWGGVMFNALNILLLISSINRLKAIEQFSEQMASGNHQSP